MTKIKGRVQCFSMQVVTNKCFLLNPEKNLAQIRFLLFSRETQKPLNSDTLQCRRNDVTDL